MESENFSTKEKEVIDNFGPNSWMVEELFSQYQHNPNAVNEHWQAFFDDLTGKLKNETVASSTHTVVPMMLHPKPLPGEEVVELKGVHAKIVENMSYSLSLPLATSFRTLPVKVLEENRKVINHYLEKNNRGKVSFTHLIGWAIVQAIQRIPAMNNAFTVINNLPHVIRKPDVNLGLAIDLEKKDGTRSLIVPNIKKANAMNFEEYRQAYDDIIRRARANKIDPSDFQGTTITLTNPGTVGTAASNPRLMLGQGAIIATGSIEYPAQYHAMSEDTIAALGIGKIMNVTSTYDHRIIQGAESGLFLKTIHGLLLGEDEFYEAVFSALRLPVKPAQWQKDNYPQFFENNNLETVEKQARVLQLINMFRVRGHLIANLDPLSDDIPFHPELDSASYGFTIWDYDRPFLADGIGGRRTAKLKDILETLHQTYCGKIGVEFRHIQSPEEKAWLQERMESTQNLPTWNAATQKRILQKLIIAESFEHFIHTKFVGHKRFSLEGSETIIPLLDHLLNIAAADGVAEVVFGMAHRGRLNVLANVIGKSYQKIFSEFEGYIDPNSTQGSGDVKYHLGATGIYQTSRNKEIKISLAPNPSHLEFVNPVVEGIVRAKQTHKSGGWNKSVLAVLIHGDAAFAGQGVVAETLHMSQLQGYKTRGTLHVIINNQIGFTTTPESSRSSTYATDVARMIQSPIFHVNGDDPEAALWVTQLAFDYRQQFEKDVVIDVYGYRRHGHNEGDEPGYTQPLLYKKIKQHPSVKTLYARQMLQGKIMSEEEVKAMEGDVYKALDNALEAAKNKNVHFQPEVPLAISNEAVTSAVIQEGTAVNESSLHQIVEGLTRIPEHFSLHPKLRNFIENRLKFIDGKADADWAFGEAMAFGSLLLEGTPIRLSGEDSVRGTFSQRHLAFTDMNSGEEYFPINHIAENQAKIEAIDSLLSETAVLGFEFGYSIADPLALVLWEAQFGDFANVAQPIIDNFIASSYAKWKLPNSLVLLLPHGYEGQGPEHSSARLERFLTLCAENNMTVCNLTTPAQYFHVLRRQIKHVIQRPLIIMTPKSLLRLPDARSSKNEFIHGRFHEVIDDAAVTQSSVRKIVLSTGKIYYDLLKSRKQHAIDDIALVRVEQLYPYASDQIKSILQSYPKATQVVWCQEEPKNMGAWAFIHEFLTADLAAHQTLTFVGRHSSASPAVGALSVHQQEQEKLIRDALE